MQEQLDALKKEALLKIESADGLEDLEKVRIQYLGRKGQITQLLRNLGNLPQEERPKAGQAVNAVSNEIEDRLTSLETEIKSEQRKQKLDAEWLDITIPGNRPKRGRVHPIRQVEKEILDIFLGMGFDIKEGPEIEWDQYNFGMLNFAEDHPARDAQDSFFLSDEILLRTHTSPVQIRTMLKEKPPIRMLAPGRVYRVDEVDATHSPMFHQMEGLVIDKNINFGHLKGMLETFLKRLYSSDTKTRFRPGFFPFTEPSAEVDATCSSCKGKGCRVCKYTGWIEILGCGMVHPTVLENCGIDPKEYSGFAFGMGIDRITNIKYGITDIRLLLDGDTRFLEQF